MNTAAHEVHKKEPSVHLSSNLKQEAIYSKRTPLPLTVVVTPPVRTTGALRSLLTPANGPALVAQEATVMRCPCQTHVAGSRWLTFLKPPVLSLLESLTLCSEKPRQRVEMEWSGLFLKKACLRTLGASHPTSQAGQSQLSRFLSSLHNPFLKQKPPSRDTTRQQFWSKWP